MENKKEGALRYDAGKAPMHLLPYDALQELAHIYGAGALKYGENNWQKGMDWSRCFNSLMRHAAAWHAGDDNDSESGQAHMLHVAWNALTIFVYASRGLGKDDRTLSAKQITDAAMRRMGK